MEQSREGGGGRAAAARMKVRRRAARSLFASLSLASPSNDVVLLRDFKFCQHTHGC